MPIIEIRVPRDTNNEATERIRILIKDALHDLGVYRNHIAVEFIPCLNPERLIITYWTRSAQELLQGDNANQHAKVVGKIVELKLNFPVECFVAVFQREATGIYLTKYL